MKKCIGIRIENKDLTERRAPLTPGQVRKVVDEHGIQVLVEPSQTRVFTNADYKNAGARISADLSGGNVIFGVKEIPIENLEAGQAYCFFSHTIKGQDYNMPMLQKILDSKITLLDYELVTDKEGRRLIFFGNFAGYAGMIDSLWALGKRLAWEGIETPFDSLHPAHYYGSLEEAEAAVREIGNTIRQKGLPLSLGPVVCGFTGYGQVSKGAQAIYDLLPVLEISPADLAAFFQKGKFSEKTVYKVEFQEKDMFRPNPGETKPFELQDYFTNPERYQANFEQYVPFLTMIVNGIYWEPRYPRILTKKYLKELYRNHRQPQLRVIGDISCDIEGSIEITVKATNSENPLYVFDPVSEQVTDGWQGTGPVMMAVDKLPTELPREASAFFGDALMPFIPGLATADFSLAYHKLDLPPEFKGAVIAHQGELTPDFKYLQEFL